MNLPVSALLVADYIIAKRMNFNITQVIKLVYIAHGFTLALLKKPLIQDAVEAWTHGPVIPALYHQLHAYKKRSIPCLTYCGTDLEDEKSVDDRVTLIQNILGKDAISIIDRVVDLYGNFTASYLSALTHRKGTPWKQHYDENVVWNDVPNDTIKRHYEEIVENGGV